MQDIQTIIMPWVEAVIGWLLAFWVQLGNQFIDKNNITGLSDGFLVEAIFILIAYALGRAAQRDSNRQRSKHDLAVMLLRDFTELHSLGNASPSDRPTIRKRGTDRLKDTLSYALERNDLPKSLHSKTSALSAKIATYQNVQGSKQNILDSERTQWNHMAVDFRELMKSLLSERQYNVFRYDVDALMALANGDKEKEPSAIAA